MKKKEPVYFLKLELQNVRCFGDKAELDLSDGKGNWKRWTVILGDNGTGKTTLLQCLAGMEQIESDVKRGEERFTIPNIINRDEVAFLLNNKIKSSLTCIFNQIVKSDEQNNTNKISYGQERGGYRNAITFPIDSLSELICYGYGANRLIGDKSLSENKSTNSETLFNDDAKLINAESWLLEMDYAASRESEIKTFAEKRRDLIKAVLLDLLPDIEDIRFTTPTKEKLTPSVEFKTAFGYWVTIHQLSLGYKTMVAWMVDVAARLFQRYPESDNPLAEPAIILVDEIDLHLHPQWQRKIFDYLSEKFPKTQFIVTAHSPLVVQAAPKDANIVVLRKEGDKVIIDNNVKSVNEWRIDQILSSELFGNLPPRSKDVNEKLERRKVLIQKNKLTSQEKIELDELNEEADKLPYAESETDNEAREIIRKAAEYFTKQKVFSK